MEKTITQSNLNTLIEKLSNDYDIYAPVVTGEFSEFALIKHLDECNLDILNTTKPLKQLFLPQSEKLFSAIGYGENLKLESRAPLNRKKIIFGAKSCDIKGVELLSNVYSSGTCKDELFIDNKNNSILIGLACLTPRDTCFCTALEINPIEEKGMDIILTKINGKYIIKTLTNNGEALLKKYNDILTDITKEDLEKKNRIIEIYKNKKQNITLDLKKIKSQFDNSFKNQIWEELSLRCINCGICTYLCPTCQCFDIHDETGKNTCMARFRTWDTCMSPDFTLMAGGHNPRSKKARRIRQRFMHKFKYYTDYFSIPYCTGCGRCIQFCPVNIDVMELLKRFQ